MVFKSLFSRNKKESLDKGLEKSKQSFFTKLSKAVEKALKIRGHSRDVIAQFLIPRFSWEQTTFILANRQHLRLVKVAGPDITAYRALLYGGGAS